MPNDDTDITDVNHSNIKKAEADFNDAMTACQKEMRSVSADATNPQTRSKYASYAKLDGLLRPIYTKLGISISYGTEDTPKAECVRVIAYVARGGYTRIIRMGFRVGDGAETARIELLKD